jgi:hypothetical protein
MLVKFLSLLQVRPPYVGLLANLDASPCRAMDDAWKKREERAQRVDADARRWDSTRSMVDQ